MSNKYLKGLSKSALKMKLEQMGMSLDRTYHPKDYYEKIYITTSNTKNKVTRNNTPFYYEKNINRKREREASSNKKKKLDSKQFEEYNPLFDEEESNIEEKNNKNQKKRKKEKKSNINKNENQKEDFSSGIKTTRLITSSQKYKKNKGNIIQKDNEISDILRSPRTRRNAINNNKNSIDDDFIYYNEGYKSRSKLKNKKAQEQKDKDKDKHITNNFNNEDKNKKAKKSEEGNIINISTKNDNFNEIIQNNIIDTSVIKNQPKDSYLTVEEKMNQKDIQNNYNNNMEIEPNNDKLNVIQNTMDLDKKESNEELKTTPSEYSASTSRFSRFSIFTGFSYLSKIGSGFVSMKNSIMNKFRKNAYLFPLIILILFGIVFFFNERYENFERRNIIIIFSIIMGLIVLFNLYKCCKECRKYKKIAKEDKQKLLELFERENIKKEDIGDKFILLNEFINERIQESGLKEDVYMKYVFPYLIKYLKKDGYVLEKQKDEEKETNDINYWKKM